MRTSPSVSTTSGRAGMADLAGTRVRRRRTIIREVQSHRLHLWDGTEPDPRYMTYAKVRRGWAQAACDCGWHTERVVDRPFISASKPAKPARSIVLDAYDAHIPVDSHSAVPDTLTEAASRRLIPE